MTVLSSGRITEKMLRIFSVILIERRVMASEAKPSLRVKRKRWGKMVIISSVHSFFREIARLLRWRTRLHCVRNDGTIFREDYRENASHFLCNPHREKGHGE